MQNAEQFPVIAHRGHRPLKGKMRRVMMGGAMVDPKTLEDHVRYIILSGKTGGEVKDAVYAFAKRKGVKKSLSVKPTIKNR